LGISSSNRSFRRWAALHRLAGLANRGYSKMLEILENVQMPSGLPTEHRLAFFRCILGAMGEAHTKLSADGLDGELVQQILVNTLAHALAVVTVRFDLRKEEMSDIFLQYVDDVRAKPKSDT
jgi:hypothetical protein